jgi:hypothetical protein
MRLYHAKRTAIASSADRSVTHRAFLQSIADAVPPTSRCGLLLLLGGADRASVRLRAAQSVVRFDQRPSYFSHVALIASWGDRLDDALGLEATWNPEDPARFAPERNGITAFRLKRYLDARCWPNLAVASLRFDDDAPDNATPGVTPRREALREALRNPNNDRLRYPIWDQLRAWAPYRFGPALTNPLLQGQAMPAATFATYVYGHAGIDLVPVADTPNACPEHIWASLLHAPPAEGVEVQVWRRILQRDLLYPDALPMTFDEEIPALAPRDTITSP